MRRASRATPPPDWVDTAANNSSTVTELFQGAYSIGGELAYATNSSESNIHSHYVHPDALNLVDYTLKVDGWIEESKGGWGTTVLSDCTGGTFQDRYIRVRRYRREPSLRVVPHGTTCSGATDTGFVPTPGEWFSLEIALSDAGGGDTQVDVRAWNRVDTRPASPQASCVTPLNAGTFGVWKMQGGDVAWDNLSATCAGP